MYASACLAELNFGHLEVAIRYNFAEEHSERGGGAWINEFFSLYVISRKSKYCVTLASSFSVDTKYTVNMLKMIVYKRYLLSFQVIL